MTATTIEATSFGPYQARQWVETTLSLLDRLSKVLEQEIDAVRAKAPTQIADLAAEKEYLTLSYSDQMKALKENPDILRNIERTLIESFQRAADSFRRLLAENARVLGIAKAANERFIKAVGDAVSEHTRPTLTYSRKGFGSAGQGARTPGVSIALDRSV
ncbi:MAG: hypothetical protein CMM50_04695 [Rhodospirillaceae bacterium]|jgi:flagellar biosynthesis/type III secretory pathway chaperone|nr:hypothetical protein [Rhodospirillaceae bacterium]